MEKNYSMNTRRNGHDGDIDVESIFLISERDFVDDRVEIPFGSSSASLAFFVSFLTIAIFFIQTAYLNVVKGEVFLHMASGNAEDIEPVDAPRGIIKDRFGTEIANNTTGFDLVVYPRLLPKDEAVLSDNIKQVADIVEVSEKIVREFVEDVRRKNFKEASLVYGLDSQKALLIRSLSFKGITVKEKYVRNYVYPEHFASVTGYVGLVDENDLKNQKGILPDEYIGRTGIEKYYEMLLRGQKGKRLITEEGKGGGVFIQPQKGSDVVLTIDGDLQRYMYDRLQEAKQSLGTDGGVGIVMDVRNGEVLSLVSLPSYNPSWFLSSEHKEDIKKLFNNALHPLFNRAVSGTYSPGSTIKPLMAFAGLREKVVTPTTIVAGHDGALVIPNPYNPNKPTIFRDWKVHGDLDVRNAIAESGNIFFYALGGGAYGIEGLGAERIKRYWELFRLGEKTNIDLPEEASGFLPSPERKLEATKVPWRAGDTYNISIGQGDLLLTPLQILRYIAAIANSGTFVQPHLVKNSAKEKLVSMNSLQESDRRWFEIVKSGMVATVQSQRGTANMLKDIPVSIAAKTGSAQIQWNTKTNALFVGFAPAENPEIAILILIENAHSASLNAVPVAHDVLLWYHNNRGFSKN